MRVIEVNRRRFKDVIQYDLVDEVHKSSLFVQRAEDIQGDVAGKRRHEGNADHNSQFFPEVHLVAGA